MFDITVYTQPHPTQVSIEYPAIGSEISCKKAIAKRLYMAACSVYSCGVEKECRFEMACQGPPVKRVEHCIVVVEMHYIRAMLYFFKLITPVYLQSY